MAGKLKIRIWREVLDALILDQKMSPSTVRITISALLRCIDKEEAFRAFQYLVDVIQKTPKPQPAWMKKCLVEALTQESAKATMIQLADSLSDDELYDLCRCLQAAPSPGGTE